MSLNEKFFILCFLAVGRGKFCQFVICNCINQCESFKGIQIMTVKNVGIRQQPGQLLGSLLRPILDI
jgi:hypothetical protein